MSGDDHLPPGVRMSDLSDDLHFVTFDDDEIEIQKGEMKGDVERDDVA